MKCRRQHKRNQSTDGASHKWHKYTKSRYLWGQHSQTHHHNCTTNIDPELPAYSCWVIIVINLRKLSKPPVFFQISFHYLMNWMHHDRERKHECQTQPNLLPVVVELVELYARKNRHGHGHGHGTRTLHEHETRQFSKKKETDTTRHDNIYIYVCVCVCVRARLNFCFKILNTWMNLKFYDFTRYKIKIHAFIIKENTKSKK